MSDQDRSAWVTLEQYTEEVKENERLREQLEKATAALLEIEQMGETAPLNMLSCQLGNIAHAARIALRLTDETGK